LTWTRITPTAIKGLQYPKPDFNTGTSVLRKGFVMPAGMLHSLAYILQREPPPQSE
jgi:hypothetical protein